MEVMGDLYVTHAAKFARPTKQFLRYCVICQQALPTGLELMAVRYWMYDGKKDSAEQYASNA